MGEVDGARLIGVDGGASTIRAWRLVRAESGLLYPRGAVVRRRIPREEGFRPALLEEQVADRESEEPPFAPSEQIQAELVCETVGVAIAKAAGATRRIVVGVCMPGLPDATGRGIVVLRHGPRLPRFLDRVEADLRDRGFELARFPRRLVADGAAAAGGEEVGVDGRFRGVASVLLVAGGTGVAEALKVDGCFPPIEHVRRWLPPVYRLRASSGALFEDLVSMSAINAAFAERAGTSDALVEERAAEGDELARSTLRNAARHLAELLLARLVALRREPGVLLERIVLGQHTARLFGDERLASCFANPLRIHLAEGLRDTDDADMHAAYLEEDELKRDLVVASALPAAPAIGAMADVLGLVIPAL